MQVLELTELIATLVSPSPWCGTLAATTQAPQPPSPHILLVPVSPG